MGHVGGILDGLNEATLVVAHPRGPPANPALPVAPGRPVRVHLVVEVASGAVRLRAARPRRTRSALLPLPRVDLGAGALPAVPPAGRVDVRVEQVVGVALGAVRLARVGGRRAFATQRVHPARDRLQVDRVDAPADVAAVAEYQSLGDRADQQLVGVAVRVGDAAGAVGERADTEAAVAVAYGATCPQPAPARAALVDLGPEALRDGHCSPSSSASVSRTPSTSGPSWESAADRTMRTLDRSPVTATLTPAPSENTADTYPLLS